MKCTRCQHENLSGQKFCGECGARLNAPCPTCGHTNAPGQKFCGECGSPLPVAAFREAPSPASYTPKHLVEKILTSKSALEGERKQVTVLFADMKGSMELLADRDPEEARKLLDPVLETMMEAVHRYEGTVNQVMGDGIMALFGAPLAHEDHAVRACYAALRMQEHVRRYAEQARHAHGVNIQVRVGLNSGEVVVRAIGSDLHMDYTAVGQTTHLAARMEQFASPGSILLTRSTLELVEGYIAVKPLGPVPVKGLADPVEVYEATGVGPARTRLQAAARRGLTRFVGRNAELELLRRAQQLADKGHGQVAAIVGEAGVGKSRLVYEFTHSHRLHGWLTLEAASVSYGKATSYFPVIDLLKGYFKIGDRDDQRQMREKITGKLFTLDESLRPMLPALLALQDVPVEDAAWSSLDPPQRRQRTLDAVRRLLLREAREQPLLVIFEDLHWIDGETQALLDALVDSLGSVRLLLLVNYRPEYQHQWGGKTYYSQMRLDALPPESAGELLEALLGDDQGLAPLKQLLLKRGNPFFLEETVRTLVETKALTGERGHYRLTQPIQAIQVPSTVQAVLAARIDRLAPEDKRLVQVASVVGKDVPFALLQAIAELAEEALLRGLEQLQAAELLYETGLFPDLEYSFKHALTHEVTYGGMLQERRRALHARIVDAIETLYRHRLEAEVERLAHHAFRGERWAQAVGYLQQAAAKAMGRSALADAATWLEQALTALSHLPESRQTIEQAIDIRFDLRNALMQLGDTERMRQHLLEAERLARALDDQPRLARVLAFLSYMFNVTGDHDRALESGEQALKISETFRNRALSSEMDLRLGQVHFALGDYGRARVLLDQRVALGEDETLRDRFTPPVLISVFARVWLGYCLAETGDFAEGIASVEKAIPLAQGSDQPFNVVGACHSLSILYLRQGRVHDATPFLERGFALSQAKNIQLFARLLGSALGLARCQAGSLTEGLSLLEESARAWQTVPAQGTQILAQLGEGYLVAGRADDALNAATRALEVARSRKEKGNEAWALYLLGEVNSHLDLADRDTAEAHCRAAFALATELGMRPLKAKCHLALGQLAQNSGKNQDAREQLTKAASMFREMDMRSWLEKAEAAFQSTVSAHGRR